MVNSRNSSVGRAARLMQLGVGLAGSYLGYRLQRPFLDKEGAERPKAGVAAQRGQASARKNSRDFAGR